MGTVFFDPDRQHYSLCVRETLNGFAVMVQNVGMGATVFLGRAVDNEMGLSLPEDYRPERTTLSAAAKELERTARLNGWVPVT